MNISDDDIEELQKLKDKGIISVEEFVSKLRIFTRKNNSVADNMPSAPMYLPPSANFRNSATITENDIKILSKLKDKKIISAEEFQAKFDNFSRQNKPVVKDTAKRPQECPISSVYESDITPPLKETIPPIASSEDVAVIASREAKRTEQKTVITTDSDTVGIEYMEKLAKFKDKGIISAEEFNAELNKFLMQQNTPSPYYSPPPISEPNNIPYYAQIPAEQAIPHSEEQNSFVGILIGVAIIVAIVYFAAPFVFQ